MPFRTVVLREDVARGQREVELPSAGLVGRPIDHPLLQQVQLVLAEGPLQPQQHPVIVDPQVVDPLGIADEGVHHPAEVQQMLPILAVPSEAGGLDAQHDADVAQSHLGDQPQETRTAMLLGAGVPLIVIDHDHLFPGPSQGHKGLGEPILPTLALLAKLNLDWRGLTHVGERGLRQVLWPDLVRSWDRKRTEGLNGAAHVPLPSSGCRSRSSRSSCECIAPPSWRADVGSARGPLRGSRPVSVAWDRPRSVVGACAEMLSGESLSLVSLISRAASWRRTPGSANAATTSGRRSALATPLRSPLS